MTALRGSDLIIHAGDVGDPAIVAALEALAPLTVVRGNVDRGPFTGQLPETATLAAAGSCLYVLHDIARLDLNPSGAFQAVVFGHSHQPSSTERNGVLFVNPGSAGPRRFKLPISVGRLRIDGDSVISELITLG